MLLIISNANSVFPLMISCPWDQHSILDSNNLIPKVKSLWGVLLQRKNQKVFIIIIVSKRIQFLMKYKESLILMVIKFATTRKWLMNKDKKVTDLPFKFLGSKSKKIIDLRWTIYTAKWKIITCMKQT